MSQKKCLHPQLYRTGSQEPGNFKGGQNHWEVGGDSFSQQPAVAGVNQLRALPGSRRWRAQAVIAAPFKPGCVSTLQATLSGVSKSCPAFISHIQTNMKSTFLHGKRDPAIHLLLGKVLNVARSLSLWQKRLRACFLRRAQVNHPDQQCPEREKKTTLKLNPCCRSGQLSSGQRLFWKYR